MSGSGEPRRDDDDGAATRPFDQTNGLVDFDAEAGRDDQASAARDLLGKGVASNAITFGSFGGN